ncbi:hypothetical protein AAZX31_05G059200 [Glycine max]|nr:hypothetical protein GLYMA_05G061033v4 [Glycine max]KAH1133045.1 hypothetical protein GYH30_011743 [Glycine max]
MFVKYHIVLLLNLFAIDEVQLSVTRHLQGKEMIPKHVSVCCQPITEKLVAIVWISFWVNKWRR